MKKLYTSTNLFKLVHALFIKIKKFKCGIYIYFLLVK